MQIYHNIFLDIKTRMLPIFRRTLSTFRMLSLPNNAKLSKQNLLAPMDSTGGLSCFSTSKSPPSLSIPEIESYWSKFSEQYNKFDYCPQTLYYSLLYMLEIQDAKNILQVACGTGKLLPIAINMKNINTKYLAVDLAKDMVELTHKNLKQNFQNYQSKLTFQQWMKKNNLQVRVANAEEKINTNGESKFDRIICNCVLMITQNAEKMLKNLYDQAESGCLLGVSVWGNKSNNNLMTSIRQSYLQSKIQLPDQRSNFHLYKKVPKLAQKCGWQVVLNWQQNALFPALQANSEKYQSFLFHQISKIEDNNKREEVKKILMGKLEKYFKENKQGINFSCEMFVLRKK